MFHIKYSTLIHVVISLIQPSIHYRSEIVLPPLVLLRNLSVQPFMGNMNVMNHIKCAVGEMYGTSQEANKSACCF